MDFQRFDIRSSVQHIADAFTVVVPDADLFLAADADQRMSIERGYRDAMNAAQSVITLNRGIIDSYTVAKGKQGIFQTTLTGRDALALLTDRFIARRFLTDFRPPVTETLPGGLTTVIDLVGSWTAKQIAEIICADLGLGCQWQTLNFTLKEDFNAVGRVSEILARLIADLNHFEPTKTIMLAEASLEAEEGADVVFRARLMNPVAEQTIALGPDGIRQEDVTVEMHPPRKISSLVLIGERINATPGSVVSTRKYRSTSDGKGTTVESTEDYDSDQLLRQHSETFSTLR